ncbi:MAG: hypothetical protein OEV35_03020, partial [Gallionellaceae bacterium]|nr:hypothetical protein [Gallionellaceae bacterium]
MNNFFSPAIRLMNRLSYTKKFALLWFMALNVTVVLLLSILFLVNKEISIAKQEIKGIDLITSILHTQQSIQLHRGLGALSIVGNTAAHNRHADVDAAINENIAKLGEMLPVNLRESNDWIKIKAGWGHLHEEQFRSDVAGYLSRSTRLIYDLMAFTQTVAHEYHLSLDSEASTYTLIDTAVTKLPAAIEHIGQLRGYGAVMLAEKRVTEEQKIQAYKSLGMLADALEMFELNVERTANYNPVLKQSLFSINNAIANITRQVVGTMESEILVGNFARDPEEFFELF